MTTIHDPIDLVAVLIFDQRGPCAMTIVGQYGMAIVNGGAGFEIPATALQMERDGAPTMYAVAGRGRSGQVVAFGCQSFPLNSLRRGDWITVCNISLSFQQTNLPDGVDIERILGHRELSR